MDLVDVKRTAADKEREKKKYETLGSPIESEDYPYGLRISLDNDTLEKLGLSGELKSEDVVHLMAEGAVIESRSSTVNGKTQRSVEIQLRKIAVKEDGEHESASEILYGAK